MSAQRSEHDMQTPGDLEISRRDVMIGAAASVAVTAAPSAASAPVPVTETSVTPTVSFNVNGQARELAIDHRTTLLDALRERLDLIGTKKGCDHGQCGACTVLIEGRRANACLIFAVAMHGRGVTTVEGLADGERLHPMQQAFIDHDGLQCGYCTPGQLVAGVACVAEGHTGSRAEIREWMSGNICRCGAYTNIVTAIEQTAAGQAGAGQAGVQQPPSQQSAVQQPAKGR